MYCKFCGERIDRETMQCVSCGKPAGSLEGGVGFWDLAGEKPPRKPSPEPGANCEKAEKRIRLIALQQNKLRKKITALSVFITIAFVCAVILGAFLTGMVHRLNEDYIDLQGSVQAMSDHGNDPAPSQTSDEDWFAEFPNSDAIRDATPPEFESDPTIVVNAGNGNQADTITSQDNFSPWQMWDAQSGTWVTVSQNLITSYTEKVGGNVQGVLLLKNEDGTIDKIYFRNIASGANDEREEISVTEFLGTEDSQ